MYDFFQICYITKKINKAIFCFGFWALGCTKKTKKNKKNGLIDGLSLLKKKINKYMYFFYFLISINKGPRRFWALAFEKPLEKQKN